VHFTRATLSELFRLALPMVVSQGAFALMMFADRFFLSRLSSTHVAASMGGGVSFWVCLCFFNGLAAYSNALVAQYYGRRDLARWPAGRDPGHRAGGAGAAPAVVDGPGHAPRVRPDGT
jgi:MATE family multidrug resistance protein